MMLEKRITEINMKNDSIPSALQLRMSVAVKSHIPSLYLDNLNSRNTLANRTTRKNDVP